MLPSVTRRCQTVIFNNARISIKFFELQPKRFDVIPKKYFDHKNNKKLIGY